MKTEARQLTSKPIYGLKVGLSFCQWSLSHFTLLKGINYLRDVVFRRKSSLIPFYASNFLIEEISFNSPIESINHGFSFSDSVA